MSDEMREIAPEGLPEIKLEIFTSQDEIIRLQSKAIQGLIFLLIQHKDVDDADFKPIKEMIDEAAMIKAELEF